MSDYPLLKFHFSVDWAGQRIDFTEVSGLDIETETINYRHGAQPDFNTMKIPGLEKYSDITLKRGMFRGDNEFYEWLNTIRGSDFRRDITIKLLDENHEPVVVWKARNAWPSKIQSTNLKASANEVAIETMVVVHEGIQIVND